MACTQGGKHLKDLESTSVVKWCTFVLGFLFSFLCFFGKCILFEFSFWDVSEVFCVQFQGLFVLQFHCIVSSCILSDFLVKFTCTYPKEKKKKKDFCIVDLVAAVSVLLISYLFFYFVGSELCHFKKFILCFLDFFWGRSM